MRPTPDEVARDDSGSSGLARFGRDAVVYGASTILARGISFLLLPILARILPPDAMGAVELGTVAIALATVVVSLEIGQGLARYVPDPRTAEHTRTMASSALWFVIATHAGLAVPIAIIAALTAPAVGLPSIIAVIAAGATSGVFLLVQGQLRWELRPIPYAASSVGYALATLVVTAGLVSTGGGVPGVFAGQAIGALVGLLIAMAAGRRSFGARPDARWLRVLLAFSIPLVPATLGALVALLVDRVVIGALLTLEDVGQFSVGARIAAAVGIVMTAVQLALTPLIYAAYEVPAARDELADLFRRVAGAALGLWLVLSLAAPELVRLTATDVFAQAATVIPLQVPAILLAGLVVFAPGLGIARRSGLVAGINLVGAVVNIGLSVMLVRAFGIVGAAAATLLSAALVFGLMMAASHRHYPIPYLLTPPGIAAGAVAIAITLSGVTNGAEAPPLVRVALGIAALVAVGITTLGVRRPTRAGVPA